MQFQERVGTCLCSLYFLALFFQAMRCTSYTHDVTVPSEENSPQCR